MQEIKRPNSKCKNTVLNSENLAEDLKGRLREGEAIIRPATPLREKKTQKMVI